MPPKSALEVNQLDPSSLSAPQPWSHSGCVQVDFILLNNEWHQEWSCWQFGCQREAVKCFLDPSGWLSTHTHRQAWECNSSRSVCWGCSPIPGQTRSTEKQPWLSLSLQTMSRVFSDILQMGLPLQFTVSSDSMACWDEAFHTLIFEQ